MYIAIHLQYNLQKLVLLRCWEMGICRCLLFEDVLTIVDKIVFKKKHRSTKLVSCWHPRECSHGYLKPNS